jgi:hypothetical protein
MSSCLDDRSRRSARLYTADASGVGFSLVVGSEALKNPDLDPPRGRRGRGRDER